MGIDSRRAQAHKILASGTSSLLDVIGQFWLKNSTLYLNMGAKGPTAITTVAYP
jgi:hypothetical protein